MAAQCLYGGFRGDRMLYFYPSTGGYKNTKKNIQGGMGCVGGDEEHILM